jgi:hypothetical protein
MLGLSNPLIREQSVKFSKCRRRMRPEIRRHGIETYSLSDYSYCEILIKQTSLR